MPVKPKKTLTTYGIAEKGHEQYWYDMQAFALNKGPEDGVANRVDLFKKISEYWLPGHFEYHEWTERVLESLCAAKWTIFSGASNSCKTFNVTSFAVMWWLCQPKESSVTFVSTSLKSLRRRTWAEVQRIHSKLEAQYPDEFGNFLDSRGLWQWERGDDKHSLCCKAVEEGSLIKVADDIKGVHTRRQMVVIEEATSVPEAIYDACFNLYSYPDEFILVVNGNPRGKLDPMGRMMMPKEGWQSVNPEVEEWETGLQINGKPATVIRFDAEKSPNIKCGQIVSRHLPTEEKVRIARANGLTPLYWSNFKGFPPPDGLTKTVFSETAIMASDGIGKHVFTGNDFQIIGAFDHARDGGDRPVLRFAKMGEIETGMMGIELMPPIIIPINSDSKNPIDFQIAEQLRRQCEMFLVNGIIYTCEPRNLAVDCGGDGAGLADIINRTWSGDIIRIQFGSSASTDSTSPEDIRPANDVYRNKRAEMYFRSRDALNHGQLKGIDVETGNELCSIQFDDSRRLICLESKKEYKLRYGKSCDLADSAVMILEVARKRGFRLTPRGETANRVVESNDLMEQAARVYEVDYAAEEIEMI